MTVSETTIETITKSLKYLKKVPSGTFFCFNYNGHLSLEADTQAEVRAIRSAFRGVVWKKKFTEWSNSWQYTGKTRNGVEVVITGCKEGPPACKMVEEVVMEERSVPVTYEKKMVEVKKVKYICPDGDKVRD
jgi:hypothetical protein